MEAEINPLQPEATLSQGFTTISEYILERLQQLGVKRMFGVPGDFFLKFLDFVEDHPTIEWVGECNELNAAYAADGYARMKNSIGVVVTTFGVGELSALNGFAGSFAEDLPVLHIVGQPSTTQQAEALTIPHTLGDGRYDAYINCARQITDSQAILTRKEDAAEKIDKLLVDCITKSRPVYLALPNDLITAKISSERLKYPLTRMVTQNNKDAESAVVRHIHNLFKEANLDAVAIVDAGVVRHGATDELKRFLKTIRLPVYVTPMGKTVVDETDERYGGVYFGAISREEVKRKVEEAKLVLLIGFLDSKFNTGNYTYKLPRERTIELQYDRTRVQHATYLGVQMKPLLPSLQKGLEEFSVQLSRIPVPKFMNIATVDPGNRITHAWFWPYLGEQWFKKGDVILTETGTADFGIIDVRLPEGSSLLAQMLWCSIGWSVSATHGASLALQEMDSPRRTILFVGDGSLQMTVQELSVMIRTGVKPIIFVLNNSGYTIERFIHGENRKYNNIVNWNWINLFKVLGDASGEVSRAHRVSTASELEELLRKPGFGQDRSHIELVEVVMDQMDAPEGLKRFMSMRRDQEEQRQQYGKLMTETF